MKRSVNHQNKVVWPLNDQKALKGQICDPKRGNINFDQLRGIFRDDQDGQKSSSNEKVK